LALGNLRQRELVLGALQDLPQTNIATPGEVLCLLHGQRLSGLGIGFVDAHLLATVRPTPGSALWARDKRLQDLAGQLAARR
jgi:hypothetical protein